MELSGYVTECVLCGARREKCSGFAAGEAGDGAWLAA